MSLVWDADLPPMEKLVLLALADCANDEGHCWPSATTLARKSGQGERTVRRAIQSLVHKRHLTQNQRSGTSAIYIVHPCQSGTPARAAPLPDRPPTPARAAPKPLGTVNPSEANASSGVRDAIQREKKAALGSCLKKAFAAPDGVSDQVWSDFLNSPKRRKAGMSDTAYAGILRNLRCLSEHGFPPGEMIALAVERGWTTVKLDWVQNDRRPHTLGRNQPNDGLSETARAAIAVFGR